MFSTLSSLLVLKEARRPDLDYEEKFVNKKDKITGQSIKDDAGKAVKVLDKVIANLAGRESATLTRAFKRYKRLLDVLKRMEEAHEKVNLEMKKELEGYFDATDNVLTRVVETVSMTATLSKYVAAADKPKKTEVDYEKVIEQLSALVAEELQPKIIEILAANTKITDPTDSVVKLSIKPKDDTPVTEGVMDTLRGWVKSITKKWNDWCASYDKKLAKIKADATKAGVVLESAEAKKRVLEAKISSNEAQRLLKKFADKYSLDYQDLLSKHDYVGNADDVDPDLWGAVYLMNKGDWVGNMYHTPIITWSKKYKSGAVRYINENNLEEFEVPLTDLDKIVLGKDYE